MADDDLRLPRFRLGEHHLPLASAVPAGSARKATLSTCRRPADDGVGLDALAAVRTIGPDAVRVGLAQRQAKRTESDP